MLSIASLMIVLAIVAVLAKKQLSPTTVKPASTDGAMILPPPAPDTTPQQQSQQIQQQVRQQLDATMQRARPMPEDK
ncbi:hypothetical protein [Polaromonas sp.]|uniref:hypothetical protein n=1 Tax=Polaromonas sp. TaxID=1869339 RepID=UPI002D7826E8|nr:hypothetical protein [Polaromonas sp.]